MCLICIEYQKKRMTKEEIKKALPEMIMFSKTEQDKLHFEKLSSLNEEEFEMEVTNYLKAKK